MQARWLRAFFILLLWLIATFAAVTIEAKSVLAQAVQAYLPSTNYNGAPVPDWGNISFSALPVITESGSLSVPSDLAGQLQYDPSRTWSAGDSLGSVLMLGDVQDAFGLQTLNLEQIAQSTGLNLSQIALSNFKLIGEQTLSRLVQAVPGLGGLQVSQVKPIADLLQISKVSPNLLGQLNVNDWGSVSIGQIAQIPQIGEISLSSLPLDQYAITDIPNLSDTAIGLFKNWQSATINDLPGLGQLSFANFPGTPAKQGFFGFIALHDMTYGPKEHTTTPTKHSITGSDVVGFHYECAQSRGCANLELNSPISLGIAGDPTGLHGAQWIKGGTSPGGQMVKGGHGILGALNGGMEPTGRLPFGPVFKVVLTDTNESQGSGQFGLFFRVCHHGLIDLGCTPYFIGPVPFLSTHEKGIVFVGETQGVPPDVQAPGIPQDVQDVINQHGGGDSSGSGQLCGSGYAGVDFKALADGISGIEGGYGSVSGGSGGCSYDNGHNGRGLGRYQYMSYRSDVRAIIQADGGGSLLSELDSCGTPSSAEIQQYFPPAAQDKLFQADQTANIKQAQSEIDPTTGKPFTGTRLIERVGQIHFGGTGARIDGSYSDGYGRLSVYQYGKQLLQNYETAEKNKGTCQSAGGNGQPGVATGHFTYPVPGHTEISSGFGEYRAATDDVPAHYHAGVDFPAPLGTPIVAADGGKVIAASMSGVGGYGSWIVIDNGNGIQEIYGHPSRINVQVGQTVAKGQVIGGVGEEGDSSGPHLHFQVMKGGTAGVPNSGEPTNPLPYLQH